MALQGEMRLQIFDVEHGACAILCHHLDSYAGRLAMIDSGSSSLWRPSTHITRAFGRNRVDYLFITNADQDHMSDLQGLWDAGVAVGVIHRNTSYTGAQMQAIKQLSGPLTNDAKRYVAICDGYTSPPSAPFNANMGGITVSAFWNIYPYFTNTNDLSQVVFFKYGAFKILFPGDLEKAGWHALLQREDFRAELIGTNVLVASHHGRESGYCEDAFKYFTPDAVVISDKSVKYDTQRTVPDYRRVVGEQGVIVKTTMKRRHVITTRRDGWILFTVTNDSYTIDTEHRG